MTLSRRRHLLVLAPLGLLFVAITLGDRHQLSDEGSYLQFAHHLAHGFYTHAAKPDLWFGPGLPLLLAPLVLVHAPLEVMRLLGPLILIVTLLLFHMTLRLFVAPRLAFVGMLALGLYVPLYPLLPSLHSEILAAGVVVAYMYSLTRYLREGRLRFVALSALMLAWLSVTKTVFGWITVLVAVALGVLLLLRPSTHVRRTLVAHLLGLVLCVPWLAYTYDVTHIPFYWGSSGGLSAYWMASTNPAQLGDWHPIPDVGRIPELARDRPEFASLRGLDQIQADKKLRDDALRLVARHPLNYAKHVLANLGRLWLSYPFTATRQKLSTFVYAVPNGLLLIALLGSAWVLWTARRALPPETAPFALLTVIGVTFQALLSAYTRMIVPLMPLMLWLVILAVTRVRVVVSSPMSDADERPSRG